MNKLFMLLLLLLLPVIASAQYSNVTAVVKDPSGNLYVNCSYSVNYVAPPNPTSFPVFTGTTTAIQQSYTGTRCDSFGVLNIRLPANTSVTPANSQWKFSICSSNGVTCFSYTGTITGASIDITGPIQAAAAPLAGTVFGGILVSAINNIQMASQGVGADILAKLQADLATSRLTAIIEPRGPFAATNSVTIATDGQSVLCLSPIINWSGVGAAAVTFAGGSYNGWDGKGCRQ
jgi:hypothetical protein